jgi:hypothetical protein
MLEEGELDDDLDTVQPQASISSSHSTSSSSPSSPSSLHENIEQQQKPFTASNNFNKNAKSKKKSLLPTPKPSLLGDGPSSSSIPSLFSPNFDNLVEKISNSINNNNNKRKKSHDKLNSKKKLKDDNHNHHHHHHHRRKRMDGSDDEVTQADPENDDIIEVPVQDQDERISTHLFDGSANYFKANNGPKAPLLATPSPWSAPPPSIPSGTKQTAAPVSLLDLFKDTNRPSLLGKPNSDNSLLGSQPLFINPIITEKENNKPKIVSDDDDEDSDMVSVDSLKEKLDKKRKYMEINKDMRKKETERAQLMQQQKIEKAQQLKEKVLCHFFVEGRCQKGDKCTFSHNMQLNPKKVEICKFYLNGFCSKGDKCFFMHGEWPCKFFHRSYLRTGIKKNECTNGEQCRFSHDPITNPLVKEAFEKYLAESSGETGSTAPALQIQIPTAANQRQSILGSPPAALLKEQSTGAVAVGDSIPSLMGMSVKPAVVTSTLKGDSRTYSPPSSPPTSAELSLKYRDVDERVPLLPQPKIIKRDMDIDERTIPSSSYGLLATPSILPSIPIIASPSIDSNYEAIKKELIIKVMKAIADEDENIFSQIPKQTLTELLVKLLDTSSSSNENKLSTNSIETLITTLTPSKPSALMNNLKRKNGAYDSDYDNDDDDMEIQKINLIEPNVNVEQKREEIEEEEEDDYDYDNDLVIEGNIGEIPYRLYEIDIEPSELWTRPPLGPNEPSFNPAALLSQLSSSSDNNNNSDQECDPRIKYYSNKANANNISNFQQLLIQQQQQQQQQQQTAPASPSSITTTTTTTITEQSSKPSPSSSSLSSTLSATTITTNTKLNRADPRLMSRTLNANNLSPTRSISPPIIVEAPSKNDLISIQNRQVSVNSLLSSLPDFQFPKENQPKNVSINPNNNNNTLQSQSVQESNTVKLSIADYKRKLQKPNGTSTNINPSNSNTSSTSQLIMNSILSNTLNSSSSLLNSNMNASSTTIYASSTTTNNSNGNSNVTSSLPSIPSYSVNLQAPQSLHELFRNFQS